MEIKHGYLVIAHTNYPQLQKLLSLLDNPRNDIYVHLDPKGGISREMVMSIPMKHSDIQVCKPADIRWGHVSQIEAELDLMELASKSYHVYYHLLSGIDLPLKSQDYIHGYFENSNKIYLGFGSNLGGGKAKSDVSQFVYEKHEVP